jgi:hypothetical protein
VNRRFRDHCANEGEYECVLAPSARETWTLSTLELDELTCSTLFQPPIHLR